MEEINGFLLNSDYEKATKLLMETRKADEIKKMSVPVISFYKNFLQIPDINFSNEIASFTYVVIIKNIDIINPLLNDEEFDANFNLECFKTIAFEQLQWTKEKPNEKLISVFPEIKKIKKPKFINFLFSDIIETVKTGVYIADGNKLDLKNSKSLSSVKTFCDNLPQFIPESFNDCKTSIEITKSVLASLKEGLEKTIELYEKHKNAKIVFKTIQDKLSVISKGVDKAKEFAKDYLEGDVEKNPLETKTEIIKAIIDEKNQTHAMILFDLLTLFNGRDLSSIGKLRSEIGSFFRNYDDPITQIKASFPMIDVVTKDVQNREEFFKGKRSFYSTCNRMISEELSKYKLNYLLRIMKFVREGGPDLKGETIEKSIDELNSFLELAEDLNSKYLFSDVSINDIKHEINGIVLTTSDLLNVLYNKIDQLEEGSSECFCGNKGKFVCPNCKNVFYCKKHCSSNCIWCGSPLTKVKK